MAFITTLNDETVTLSLRQAAVDGAVEVVAEVDGSEQVILILAENGSDKLRAVRTALTVEEVKPALSIDVDGKLEVISP